MVKVGFRKPNLKSSLKARTTGRAKRAVKRAVIPGYGKKGAGWIKNPKKAAYNYVHHRTTIGAGDVAKAISGGSMRNSSRSSSSRSTSSPQRAATSTEIQMRTLESSIQTTGQATVALILCALFGYLGVHRFYARMYGSGALYLFTMGLLLIGWIRDIYVLAKRRMELAQVVRA